MSEKSQDPPLHESELPRLQNHPVKADNVHPRPVSRRQVGIVLAVIGLVVVLNTVGNFIGVSIANGHANSIVAKDAIKSHERDLERDAIENQLKSANNRIDTLVTQVRAQQTGDDNAICVLLIGIIEQSKASGMSTSSTGLALVKPVLTQLHCVVPPGLLT